MSAMPTHGDAGGNCGLGLLYSRWPGGSERAIAQAIVYLACAPKSNAATLRLKPRWPMLANVRIMTCGSFA